MRLAKWKMTNGNRHSVSATVLGRLWGMVEILANIQNGRTGALAPLVAMPECGPGVARFSGIVEEDLEV